MNKTKKLYLPIAAALLLSTLIITGLSTASAVQTPGDIAVVDTERILQDSAFGKQILAELQSRQQAGQAEMTQLQEQIQAKRKQVEGGRLSLSEQELQQLTAEYQNLARSAQRRAEELQREISKLRDAKLKEFEAKVMPVINAHASELGYRMVFRKFESGLVYVDDQIDITDQILVRLDAQP